MCSKVSLSKLRPHFPGVNELKHSIGWYMTEARQHCSLSSLISPCLYKWSPDSMDSILYICYIFIYWCFRTEFPEHIGAWWCIYTSVNCIIIGLGNGLLPIQPQAITINNADFRLTGPPGINFSEYKWKDIYLIIQENVYQNVISINSTIWFRA